MIQETPTSRRVTRICNAFHNDMDIFTRDCALAVFFGWLEARCERLSVVVHGSQPSLNDILTQLESIAQKRSLPPVQNSPVNAVPRAQTENSGLPSL